MASTAEGRRWSRTSFISGSSFFPHILESAELIGMKVFEGFWGIQKKPRLLLRGRAVKKACWFLRLEDTIQGTIEA